MAIKKPSSKGTREAQPKPHCPTHDVPVVVTMVMPGWRIEGRCPQGCAIKRGGWVNR